ncbi:uncharacterized protein [Montipora foliosa]|uniref:uncharacterized protein isoform X2 n=1 Tax=Montipora foliosa TaxID=591990 RepID=UPI0035F17306
MQLSYFYHVFLAYVWLSLEAPHLCRSAVVASRKKQNLQQYLTAINTCLQKCSGDVNARRPMMKITEGQQPCYDECLLKIAQIIWANAMQHGDTHGKECDDSLYTKDALNETYIHINFLPCTSGSKTYDARVSWTPRPEFTNNWTGYKVVYRFRKEDRELSPHFCRNVVGKDITSTIVSIQNEGRSNLFEILVAVTSLLRTPWKTKAIEDVKYIPSRCTLACDCHPNGTSEKVCHTKDRCPCKSGYRGLKCDQCATGYYGFPDCRASETTRKSSSGPVATTPSDSLSKEAAAATGAACLSFLLLVAVVCWWRFKKQKREATFASFDLDFKFDAFIIYSTVDEKWVTKKLLPTLESKHEIKCCIHYRDFVPGVPFTKNMADSVYNSKKTVAVVSKSFLTSNFCSHELSIALHRLAERGDDSVVVIKLDDVKNSQLPKELRFRSYIDFTKSTDKETWEYKLVTLFKA